MFSSTAHLESGLDLGWEYEDGELEMSTVQPDYKFALGRFLACMIGYRHPVTLIPLSRKSGNEEEDWENIYTWMYDELISDQNAFKDDEFAFTIENSRNFSLSSTYDKEGFLVRIEAKRKKRKRKRKEDDEGIARCK